MKYILSTLLLIPFLGHAQTKATVRDSVIQLTLTPAQFKSLIYVIDQNVDSKKETKDIIDFLTKSAKWVVEDKTKKDGDNYGNN